MDKEQINKIEEYLETRLFGKTHHTDNELKEMQVIILYLIYQKLKDIDDTLSLIDEALSTAELKR
ncbi:MAG: hypothetical protein ACO2ON_03850 [Candidatus Nanopusillus sp.]